MSDIEEELKEEGRNPRSSERIPDNAPAAQPPMPIIRANCPPGGPNDATNRRDVTTRHM